MVLVVDTAADGERLALAFAEAFGVADVEHGPAGTPTPLRMRGSTQGVGAVRYPNGSFGRSGSAAMGWTAAKWTIDGEAEVYFDTNRFEAEGEWSEKRPADGPVIARAMMRALHGG